MKLVTLDVKIQKKDLPGWEGLYVVTSDGRIWAHAKRREERTEARGRAHEGMWLRACSNGKGYLYVALRSSTCVRKISVHRLVAITFLPNPRCLPAVNHKDGDKTNNNVENLEWCSYSENTLHAMRTGLHPGVLPLAAANRTAVLLAYSTGYTEKVLAYRMNGESYRSIAARIGLSATTVRRIVSRAHHGA